MKLFNLLFYECGKILKYKVLKYFMPISFSTQTTKGTLKIRYEYASEMRWQAQVCNNAYVARQQSSDRDYFFRIHYNLKPNRKTVINKLQVEFIIIFMLHQSQK